MQEDTIIQKNLFAIGNDNNEKNLIKKNNKILSKYSLNDLPINRQSLEKLGRFLIDFAGQSDTFIFDSLDKRRLIIDDLCSQEFRDTSERIKSIW